MTDQELSEVIRVYRQYNMSFHEFISLATSRAPGYHGDHKLLMGIRVLDKKNT